MKTADNIKEFGRIKNFVSNSPIHLIGIDLETIDNDMFLLGFYDDTYKYTLSDHTNYLFENIVKAVQNSKHFATWTRYDNTHLLKMLFDEIGDETKIRYIIDRLEKKSAKYDNKQGEYEEPPLMEFTYKTYQINLDMVIRNCLLFRVIDKYGTTRTVWSYDIKNLYTGYNLEEAVLDNGLEWYSKISEDSHIIDKKSFNSDIEYQRKVLLSNELDSRAAKELGTNIQFNFFKLFESFPKNLISAGSLARSAITAMARKLGLDIKNLNIKSVVEYFEIPETDNFNPNSKVYSGYNVIDYSMKAYHGGKIDSYVLGYTPKAFITDKTSAYPSVLRELKSFKDLRMKHEPGMPKHNHFNYLFVRCNLNVKESTDTFATPFIIPNPLNNLSNINPYGWIRDIVLTKFEYQFVLDNPDKIEIEYIDHIWIDSSHEYTIFRPIIDELVEMRLFYRKEGLKSLETLIKTIINSLYGITYELNPLYDNDLGFKGLRGGDFFNPILASHITAGTRVSIAEMNNEILKRGGKILLNMTDSILYTNADITDLTRSDKLIGSYETPSEVTEVIILGSGRYEYIENMKYKFKTRGFTAKTSATSYYKELLQRKLPVTTQLFVTPFRSTTNDYSYKDIGKITESSYNLDPFNLGGKRSLDEKSRSIDLSINMVDTKQIYLDKYLFMEG